MKREELIDYTIWLIKNVERGDTPSFLVEKYLSINSAQGETPNVAENEQAEEVCPICGAKLYLACHGCQETLCKPFTGQTD